jgi:hypothetical protein
VFGRPGRLGLCVLDLLEDLAHPGSHQLAGLGRGIAVTPPYPGRLRRIEIIGHGLYDGSR